MSAGELYFIDPPAGTGLDVMALTGPLPDSEQWAEIVGPALAPYTVDWDPWQMVDVLTDEQLQKMQAATAAGTQQVDTAPPGQQQGGSERKPS